MKKVDVEALRRIVAEGVRIALAEARKKKAKKAKKEDPKEVRPKEYQDGGALQMHEPMGDRNLYRRQGVSNMGPYTSEGLKRLIAKTIAEQLRPRKRSR